MKYALILIVTSALASTPSWSSEAHSFKPGDGTVDGTRLAEYQATWKQCVLQEGVWTDGGEITETATVIGPLLRHRQATRQPNGISAVATNYLERSSLRPLRLEQMVHGPDGTLMGQSQRALGEHGFSGWTQRSEAERQAVQGTLGNMAFNGSLLGIPLTTLDFSHQAYRFNAFMMQFEAFYEVWARLAGEESFDHNGETLTMRLVDIEWHHDNGDVYPPGPDASGGRFWILTADHASLPRVIRYKTDTYAVEALPQVCAEQ